MGNTITFNRIVSDSEDSLVMSNGLTDVLIDVLLLGGSELAEKESEKRLIAFLSEKQQSIIGMGTVGFSITDMPWDADSFDNDKQFLLNTVSYARKKTGWNKLGYEPPEESVTYALDGFELLVERMNINFITGSVLSEWLSERKKVDPVMCGNKKCPLHGLIMSFFGCKLCNDCGGEYGYKQRLVL